MAWSQVGESVRFRLESKLAEKSGFRPPGQGYSLSSNSLFFPQTLLAPQKFPARRIPLGEHVKDLVKDWSEQYLAEAKHWDGTAMCTVAQMCLAPHGWGVVRHDPDVGYQWLQRARKKKDDTRTNVQALLLLHRFFPDTLTDKEREYLDKYYPNNLSDYGDDLNILPRTRPEGEDSEVDEPESAPQPKLA